MYDEKACDMSLNSLELVFDYVLALYDLCIPAVRA